ncbi:hypothetical protein GCM10011273_24840 [Asticcacaulis endophyticus]|uniref:Uncharacterized protein n=1 Tax=Asticcacaulis endophyticus TaxID=1395890 RepID=A0A918Q914_9CAUL|nr:hypothetical protein GCM10011273_24840 [Asticcacaulis endophyticus]
MAGHPYRHAIQTSPRQITDPPIISGGQNERQGAWPKHPSQRARAVVKVSKAFGYRQISDMNNQRVEMRTAFCRIYLGNGRCIPRTCPKTINGFGRQKDEISGI